MKPTVFNYGDYEEAKRKLANQEIQIRILGEELAKYKDEVAKLEEELAKRRSEWRAKSERRG